MLSWLIGIVSSGRIITVTYTQQFINKSLFNTERQVRIGVVAAPIETHA